MENLFLTVDEVRQMLGVSKSYAYKVIRKMNSELRQEGYADKYSTPIVLKRILKNLSELDSMQRTERISEYNNLIAEIGKEKITLGKSLNYILSGVGFIPIIGTGASIISLLLQLLEDSGVKRKMVKKKIESGSSSIADEVYLLDKLSRVAKISLQ